MPPFPGPVIIAACLPYRSVGPNVNGPGPDLGRGGLGRKYTTRYTFTPCGIFYFCVEWPTYVSVSSDIHNTFTPCGIFYFYAEGPTYVSVSSDIHNTLHVYSVRDLLLLRRRAYLC